MSLKATGSGNYESPCNVLANRRNIHHRPALLWHFRDSGAGYKTADLLTLLTAGADFCLGKTWAAHFIDMQAMLWTQSVIS